MGAIPTIELTLPRSWPLLWLFVMVVAPFDLNRVWSTSLDNYYISLFPLAAMAIIFLLVCPTSRLARIASGVLVTGACTARAFAISTEVMPLPWLASALWLSFGWAYIVCGGLAWMTQALTQMTAVKRVWTGG